MIDTNNLKLKKERKDKLNEFEYNKRVFTSWQDF